MRKEELLKIIRGNAKETEIFQMQGKEAVYSLRYDLERKQYIFSFDGWEEYLENMTVPVLKEIWTRQKEQIAEQEKNNTYLAIAIFGSYDSCDKAAIYCGNSLVERKIAIENYKFPTLDNAYIDLSTWRGGKVIKFEQLEY